VQLHLLIKPWAIHSLALACEASDGFLQQAGGIASPPDCRNVTLLLKSPAVSAEMVLPGAAREK